MNFMSDIVRAFNDPANIPTDIRQLQQLLLTHIKQLQQLLPMLENQDMMLKQSIKSYKSSVRCTRRTNAKYPPSKSVDGSTRD